MLRLTFSLLLCLLAIDLVASSVNLGWDPNQENNIRGYNIYWGGKSAAYTNFVFAGNVTNYTLDKLVPGGKYFFVATAINDLTLESDFSNEVSYQVPNKLLPLTNFRIVSK